MKIAIVGSRNLRIDNLDKYLPSNTTEIVSGGAKGVDQSAREYAIGQGVRLIEFLPDYHRYGRVAPIKRNLQIVEYADAVIAFWDGESKGTKSVIEYCNKISKSVTVVLC